MNIVYCNIFNTLSFCKCITLRKVYNVTKKKFESSFTKYNGMTFKNPFYRMWIYLTYKINNSNIEGSHNMELNDFNNTYLVQL